MEKLLKILMVEDNLFDAELIRLELRKINKDFESRVVQDEKNFLNELETFQPDLILSGYTMPQFTGLDALDIAKKKCPKIPFIIVTGTLNDEIAVKCIRWGAWDYVLKDRLVHLGHAIQNAIKLKAENEKKKLAEKSLRESEGKYRSLIEQSLQGLIIIQDFRIVFANSAFAEISGYSVEDLLSHSPEKIRTLIHPEDQPLVWKRFRDRLEGKPVPLRYEYRGLRKNGTVRWLEMFANRIEYYGKPAIQGAVIDITKRKQAEEALRSAKLEKEIILDSLTDHVIYEDKEMKILWANKSACKSVDLTREELVGRYCYEIWPQRSDPCPDCPVIKAMKTKKPQEIKKSTPDGRIWFIRGYPIRDEKGDIVGGIEVTSDITERKKAEEALQESEEKFRNFVETSADLVFRLTKTGRIDYISPKVEDLYGYKPEELIGKHLKTTTPVGEVSKTIKAINMLLAGKQIKNFEINQKHKLGRIIPMEINAVPIYQSGEIVGLQGIMRDITERKQVEKALQESESKFRTLFEEAPAAVTVVDNSGVVVSCNESTEKLTGYHRKEIIGKPFKKLMTLNPEDLSRLDEYFEKLVVGIEVEPYLLQIIRKDGKRRWIRIQNSLLRKGEKVIGIQVYAVDITNRIQAEKALQESEEKYRTLIDNVNIGVYRNTAGPKGKFIEVNPAIIKMFGYKNRKEFLGINVTDLYQNPEDRKKFNDRMLKDGFVKDEELLLKKKDGTLFFGSVSTVAIKDGKGEVIYYDGVITNITERKQAEKALRASEERFKQVADSAGEWIWELDAEGMYTYSSPVLEKILGYRSEEIVGKKHFFDFFRPDEKNELKKGAFNVFNKKESLTRFINTNIHKDGHAVILETSGGPMLDEDGKLLGYRGADTDITERKKAEDIQKTLLNISSALNTTDNMPDLYSKIREFLGDIIDTTNFYVALYDEKTDMISLPFDVDEKDEFETFPAGKTITKYVIKTGKPLLATKGVERKLIKKGLIETVGASSEIWLGVPLKIENHVIGVIAVQSYDDPNLYTEKDMEILSFVSDEIALAINKKRAEEQIKRDLEEKEILLQEIHHRVKNNMQIISSLLKLQSAHIKDKRALELFQNSRDRVKTMALIHDALYRSKDLANIDFAEYVRKLTTQIFVSYGTSSNLIKIKINIKDVLMDINTAIPCGLIINELVSNSLKYAFPEGRKGEISISFNYNNKVNTLYVKDNGIGISGKIDLENSSTLGLLLVSSLTKQLDGTLKLEKVKGTSFKITFKKIELKTYGKVQS